MTAPRFTHMASMYGFPCYYNEDTIEVKGTNFFYDAIIGLLIKLEQLKPLDDGFVIKVYERIPDTHKINRAL